MPAYNAGRFIEEAIRSVMDQTYRDWQLLVIDDGSTDDTVQVVQRLCREDDRITLLQNPENMGVAHSRNRGLSLCQGRWAALLDSDDVWHPGKLEAQLALAEKTGAQIIYCSYGIMNEQGEKRCEDFIVPEAVDFDRTLIQSNISCSTALLSPQIAENYRFDKQYYHEDLALWLQLLRDGYQARGVTEVLAQYRVMEGTRASNKLRSAANRWEIFRKMLGFSVIKSGKLILQYGLLGLKKYKKQTPKEESHERTGAAEGIT
jgi:teichuronic acid biosynthesis glycosyltransferase TuaG